MTDLNRCAEFKQKVGISEKYLVLLPISNTFVKKSYGRNNGLLCGQTKHVKYAHKYNTFEEAFAVWGSKMIWDKENPGYDVPRIVTIETASKLEK